MKRYSAERYSSYMSVEKDGEWVRYSDIAPLVEAAKKELRSLDKKAELHPDQMCLGLRMMRSKLRAELAKLEQEDK